MSVDVSRLGEGVRIVVSDDGRGFPFVGRYDHTMLVDQDIGPASLRERAAELGGRIAIESSASGARVEIDLPLTVPLA